VKSRTKAILFDHDGVLVASEAIHQQAWLKLCQKLHLSVEVNEITALVGRTAPEIAKTLLDRHLPGWEKSKTYDTQKLALEKNDFYQEIIRTALKPYPGTAAGLERLRSEGYKLAVVSNAKKRELEAGLQITKLFNFFDLVLSRDDLLKHKPDPLAYLTAVTEFGLNPEECLAVEDSPTGIESALVGKIPAAAILTNFPRSVMEHPVPGRPDLKPLWIGESLQEFFHWVSNRD